jgi:protein-tyrosine phosphatase
LQLDRTSCDAHLLKKAHYAIDKFLKTGPVLVHCLAGSERSPLVVATWLCERHSFTLGEAYKLLMRKRPIVEERAFWLSDATNPADGLQFLPSLRKNSSD